MCDTIEQRRAFITSGQITNKGVAQTVTSKLIEALKQITSITQ